MYRLILPIAVVLFVWSSPMRACRVSSGEARSEKIVDLSTITKSQLECMIEEWPVSNRYIKACKLRRWYNAAGEPVAELSRRNGHGITSVKFTQGASDYRFARVYRNGRQIGFAAWVLKNGKWELFLSSWVESRLPTSDSRKAESPFSSSRP